jgi:hypothetical protein
MRGIYQRVKTGATVILLAVGGPAQAEIRLSEPQTLLWTQPLCAAAGDRFLAVGYPRGMELWNWPPDSLPSRASRLAGASTSAEWARDSSLYWCEADSTLHAGVWTQAGLEARSQVALGGPPTALAGSDSYVAIVIGTERLRFLKRDGSSVLSDWAPPAGRPVAYVALRDSTAAVVGADKAYLLRLRTAGALVLDSLDLGAFAQAVTWAGDSLYMVFGFSGLKMIPVHSDRFGDSLFTWTSAGTYGQLAVTEDACAGFDVFGRIEVFARGDEFQPRARLVFDGTLRMVVGRAREIAVFTFERGLSILNLFTVESPFWSQMTTLPGFVRDLAMSPLGAFALADFSGVYELSQGEALRVHFPYNAVSLSVDGPHLAATSLLAGVAVADLSAPSTDPYAVVRTYGLGRKAAITLDRLFVADDAACDTDFAVYQLSPPHAPLPLTRFAVCGTISDLTAHDGVVALAVRDSGLRLLDAMAPDSQPLYSTPKGETWAELEWQDGELWGRNRTNQLVRWHWDGSALTEIDRFDVPGLRAFDVWQSRVATSDSSKSITLWDAQQGLLVPRDSVKTTYVATPLLLVADTLWAVDRDAVLRFELPQTQSVTESVVRPQALLLQEPYPNPFNGRVTVVLHLTRGSWSLAIVDLLGRVRAQWQGVAASDGPRRIVWEPDGAAASGVYFLRAENGTIRQSRKVLYLK